MNNPIDTKAAKKKLSGTRQKQKRVPLMAMMSALGAMLSGMWGRPIGSRAAFKSVYGEAKKNRSKELVAQLIAAAQAKRERRMARNRLAAVYEKPWKPNCQNAHVKTDKHSTMNRWMHQAR